MQPQSPTKVEKNLRWIKMQQMRQGLLNIRERRKVLPQVDEPSIVKSFRQLTEIKKNESRKKQLKEEIEQKKQKIEKLKIDLHTYKQKYNVKNESFRERNHLQKILSSKMEAEYEKTKEAFIDVKINQTILNGLRKLSYFRLAQILFNEKARNVFHAIEAQTERNHGNLASQAKSDEQIGICLGYLGLLIKIVGYISGARLWFDFTFKGSKSTLRLNDGTYVVLRPREARFTEGRNMMAEQLYQIMNHDMGIKVPKGNNLYQMCEQLSKFMMS